ncbi:restriction endonuclease subunit S [Bacteroidota bacterium]
MTKYMNENAYKQTEIGIIPSNWEVKPLNEISVSIASGKSKTKTQIGASFPIYGSTGIIGFSTKPDYKGIRILIARVGANAGIVNYVEGEYCISDNTLMVLLEEKIDFSFIFYFLKYSNLNKLIFGSGQPLITGTQIKCLHIPLPPTKAEQTAIATALSDADALVSSLEILIAKKRLIKQGAMQELLKPKEGWVEKKLGEIGSFKNGINKPSNEFGYGYPFVNLLDVFGKSRIFTTKNLSLVNTNDLERKMFDLKKGDLLFVRSSVKPEGVGLTCLITKNLLNTVFSGFIIRFRENGFLSDEFKEYCFNSFNFRKKLILSSTVSANTNINQEALKILTLFFPKSQQEQIRIAQILTDIDTEIDALEKKLEKYKIIKQGMMQNLLTGKIRLV